MFSSATQQNFDNCDGDVRRYMRGHLVGSVEFCMLRTLYRVVTSLYVRVHDIFLLSSCFHQVSNSLRLNSDVIMAEVTFY